MVEIYTASYCPFCLDAVKILFKKGTSFQVIDVTSDEEQRKALTERTGCNTIPQVFIHGTFIGGCSDLQALEEEGELDKLLESEESLGEAIPVDME
jgi:glutaredoxin 3